MHKTYFEQLGAGSPVIFGEEAELAHVWVLLWLPGLSRVDRLILASSIYPKEELQQCQPAAPGSRSLFTQLLEFLLGARGLQGHCPGPLGAAAVVSLPSSLGESGTVWDPWE